MQAGGCQARKRSGESGSRGSVSLPLNTLILHAVVVDDGHQVVVAQGPDLKHTQLRVIEPPKLKRDRYLA